MMIEAEKILRAVEETPLLEGSAGDKDTISDLIRNFWITDDALLSILTDYTGLILGRIYDEFIDCAFLQRDGWIIVFNAKFNDSTEIHSCVRFPYDLEDLLVEKPRVEFFKELIQNIKT